MELDERVWRVAKRHLRYSDEELEKFREDPRNEAVLKAAQKLQKSVIVLEVVQAHGCNSGHRVGDRFYFDGAGNLLTELSPSRVCGYSLNAALMMVFTANEMIYAGADPNEMRFRRSSCFDVGLECGGWGRIVLELSVHDRDQLDTKPE
jgi:uncharacterized repeat protein (TIGR04076 family)